MFGYTCYTFFEVARVNTTQGVGQFSPRVENLELLNTLYNNIDIVCRREKDEVSIW